MQEAWKEKACSEFSISGCFFDLVPNLSGEQRYLQIKSYFCLDKDLLANSLDEGVYEAYRGCIVSLDSASISWANFFFTNLREEKVNFIMSHPTHGYDDKKITYLFTRRLEDAFPLQEWVKIHLSISLEWGEIAEKDLFNLCYLKNKHAVYYATLMFKLGKLSLLTLMLCSIYLNDANLLDCILRKVLYLPPGFALRQHVPRVLFWQSPPNLSFLQEFRDKRTNLSSLFIAQVCEACASMGNIRLMELVLYLYSDRVPLAPPVSSLHNIMPYDCEAVYTICYRFGEYVKMRLWSPELAFLYLERANREVDKMQIIASAVRLNMGNVAYLKSVSCNPKFRYYLKNITPDCTRFPLCASLCQNL